MKKIMILLMMSIFISPVIAIGNLAIDSQIIENSSKNYTTLVDHMHGFHIVYESNKNRGDILVKNYQNRTLNINIGDTVFWSNDAVPETELTILSKENLWKNITCGRYLCADLRWNYKKFGYTFNKSGIYKIYVKQFPIFNQTIIVGPLDTTNITNKTVNQTNITKPNLVSNNINNATNVSTNNSIPASAPIEKKPGTEAVVLISVTSLLIYIFDRKIK